MDQRRHGLLVNLNAVDIKYQLHFFETIMDYQKFKKMKRLACLYLLFISSFCYAQNQSRIISKKINPKAGVENIYIYQPPSKIKLPARIMALVLYQKNNEFYKKALPIIRKEDSYEFVFKSPDSVFVLIIGIVDADKKEDDQNGLIIPRNEVIDNNKDSGFIIYLRSAKGKRFANEKISLANLSDSYAPYYLSTKKMSFVKQVKLYQDTYKLYPQLIEDGSYFNYLTALYKVKGDVVKSNLISYARRIPNNNIEEKWLNARQIYELLKMDMEVKELEKKILVKFPLGQFAKNNFWSDFQHNYIKEDDSEQSLISVMDEYMIKFNDFSDRVKDEFYGKIMSMAFNKKDWGLFSKYEQLHIDKSILAYMHNFFARKLCDGKTYNPETDLEIAKSLSMRSVIYCETQLRKSTVEDEIYESLQADYLKYINTYALILYKLKLFDSAYYYQHIIYTKDKNIKPESIELYALYSEKTKGAIYAKEVLEENLLKGVNSPLMLQQLQSIYKQLNLPEDEFARLQKKNKFIAEQTSKELIKTKLGTTSAENFTLRNIEGKSISLSSFKNKVVVLDFWATWCGPCRASFPAMQELINKYKEDTGVVFLFIDTWERTKPQKMKEAASKLIKDKGYSFNVLLDIKDEVVADYKVEGIPAKFIINGKGEIVFMGDTSNIELEIENAKD